MSDRGMIEGEDEFGRWQIDPNPLPGDPEKLLGAGFHTATVVLRDGSMHHAMLPPEALSEGGLSPALTNAVQASGRLVLDAVMALIDLPEAPGLRGAPGSPERWQDIAMLAGRNNEPTVAWAASVHPSGPRGDHLVRMVRGAWTSAEWPQQSLPFREWVRLLRLGTHDVTEPVTLYRGDSNGRRKGRRMSWTADRPTAVWFAARRARMLGGDAVVLTATIEPKRILADFRDDPDERPESEVVIDPTGLRFTSEIVTDAEVAEANERAEQADQDPTARLSARAADGSAPPEGATSP